jgi:hypothetical protein
VASENPDRPQKKWRRYGGAAIGVLGAFGILSAIGTNVVNEIFPSVSEEITGTGSLRVTVNEASSANDGFSLATWSPAALRGHVTGIDGCDSLFAAADGIGAARVGVSIKTLVVEGSTHRDVTMVDLRPEILARKPPMRGAFVGCQSAGGVAPIGLSFDFDERLPVARQANGASAEWGEPYFGNGNVIVLRQGEVQPIQVRGTSTHDYVAWNLVADLLVDGEREELTIDDEGRPFQITGAAPGLKFERYYEWPSVFPEKPQHLYISREPLH